MNERISRLLRTNTALIFLCFISIGVFFVLKEKQKDDISINKLSQNISDEKAIDGLAKSPLKHMPSPDIFSHFIYAPDQIVSVEGVCGGKYRVVLIFPTEIDYRIDTMAAKYNVATECVVGESYTETIKDSKSLFKPGDSYYIVRAIEGDSGFWYGPY